eukprot:9244056-Alexandrium_andersonii.AAC.1
MLQLCCSALSGTFRHLSVLPGAVRRALFACSESETPVDYHHRRALAMRRRRGRHKNSSRSKR